MSNKKEILDEDKMVPASRTRKSTTLLLYEGVIDFIIAVVLINIASIVIQNLFGINKLYVFYSIGLYVSHLVSYYKFKILLNPDLLSDYDCNCKEKEKLHGILSVIDHKKGSMLFNIPNSIFAMLYYGFMLTLMYTAYSSTNNLMKFASLFTAYGSLYLWYTMIFEIRFNCILSIILHAINYLIFHHYFL
jgi:uncharacterized membrane protein